MNILMIARSDIQCSSTSRIQGSRRWPSNCARSPTLLPRQRLCGRRSSAQSRKRDANSWRRELERAVAIARRIGRHRRSIRPEDLHRREVGPLVVIDASAIIAVLAEEPKGREVVQALKDHDGPFAVPPMTVESTLGLARPGSDGSEPSRARISPRLWRRSSRSARRSKRKSRAVSPYLARKAIEAAARFGKIVGHKADLNFGDCFATYAQARSEALLFVRR